MTTLDRRASTTPRLIRITQAHLYLSVPRNWFTVHVRPYLRVAKVGKQGLVVDRLELDRWADAYLAGNGRRPADEKGETSWAAKQKPGFAFGAGSGTSTVCRDIIAAYAWA